MLDTRVRLDPSKDDGPLFWCHLTEQLRYGRGETGLRHWLLTERGRFDLGARIT